MTGRFRSFDHRVHHFRLGDDRGLFRPGDLRGLPGFDCMPCSHTPFFWYLWRQKCRFRDRLLFPALCFRMAVISSFMVSGMSVIVRTIGWYVLRDPAEQPLVEINVMGEFDRPPFARYRSDACRAWHHHHRLLFGLRGKEKVFGHGADVDLLAGPGDHRHTSPLPGRPGRAACAGISCRAARR